MTFHLQKNDHWKAGIGGLLFTGFDYTQFLFHRFGFARVLMTGAPYYYLQHFPNPHPVKFTLELNPDEESDITADTLFSSLHRFMNGSKDYEEALHLKSLDMVCKPTVEANWRLGHAHDAESHLRKGSHPFCQCVCQSADADTFVEDRGLDAHF